MSFRLNPDLVRLSESWMGSKQEMESRKRKELGELRSYPQNIRKLCHTVLKKSFKICCVIDDGIINLVDKFFEMPRQEAIKALEVYRRAGQQVGSLSDFCDICKGLELARNFQFPLLREPSQSFLATMEGYIREAPRHWEICWECC